MSKKDRIKAKARLEKRRLLQKQAEAEEQDDFEELDDPELLTEEEELALLEGDAPEPDEEEELEKAYYGDNVEVGVAMTTGPTTFEELDAARIAEKKAMEIRKASWDVEDLVHNIIRTPMLQGDEKADFIKKVGTDFGERVKGIMDTPGNMFKEHEDDPELLGVEALIASDERNKTILEKAWDVLPFQKKELSGTARKALSDSDFALPEKRKYPIHDKAHVRNALARAAQMIKQGGEAATDAKKALPKIRAAAKKFGIGASMEKGQSGIIIQKDAQGDWRWVGWPSNNFIDRSQDILTEGAHQEYVDWWHKSKDGLGFPIFTSMHAPGTAREHPVDFVGYENGFLVMSGKLTESEAVNLMKAQKDYTIGMSHTGWGVRDVNDPRQIVMYRIYEVTDLPLEMADNPFTDLAVISKEAAMKKEEQLEYLATLMGSKERAEEALELKTSMKQKELQEAQVEQKEAAATPDGDAASTPDMKAILEAVSKELDIEGLNTAFAEMQASLEKVPLLEDVIKQQQETIQKLTGEQEEQLAEKLSPPAARFVWSKENQASQADETKVDGEEKEKLQANAPGIPEGEDYWLSNATGFAPVTAEIES